MFQVLAMRAMVGIKYASLSGEPELLQQIETIIHGKVNASGIVGEKDGLSVLSALSANVANL